MSEPSLQKIDKYYLSLVVVLILMAVLLVFSFKGVFAAFLTASSFDPSAVGSQIKLDKESLDSAYEWAYSRQVVQLKP